MSALEITGLRRVYQRKGGDQLEALPAFALAMVTAGLDFGVWWITIHHPLLFVLAMLATAATATALAALFIVAPGARIVPNTPSRA